MTTQGQYTIVDLFDGADGKGISSVTKYYLASSASSGVTTNTSGWSTTIQSTTSTLKYLWSYDVTTYTDATSLTTSPVIIGTYGDKGDKGDTGSTGKGISSITEYYLVTSASSGVTTATAGWSTTVQTVTSTNRYLWNYEKVTYTDASTSTTTPVIIGVYGDKGDTGGTGAAGKGISSITEYYLATSASSGVTTATAGWSTGMQSLTPTNKYLWNYERVTYTDSSTTNSVPVIIGVYGDTGSQGPQGTPGTPGTQYYTWIKYADDAAGTGMSDTPTNKKYMGVAVNKTSAVESAIAGDYTWSLIQGPQGTPGTPGADGVQYWTWVKYADDGVGNGISDSPVNKRFIGIAVNKTSQNESTTPSDYTWSPLYDNVKVGGTNLALNSKATITNSNYNIQNYNLSRPLIVGQTYTATLKGILGAGKTYFGLWLDGGNIGLGAMVALGNGMYSLTFSTPSAADLDTISVFTVSSGVVINSTIEWFKVEDGNIGTDWSPAPEDPIKASQLQGALNLAAVTLNNANSTVFTDASGNWFFVDPVDANKVVKISSAGIGVSTTGINGTYQTAITGSGIVADLITAGTMLADRIRGGKLSLGGVNNTNGTLEVLDANGESIVTLNATTGGFDELYVGTLRSPSVVSVNNSTMNLYVDPINGIDSNDGSNFANAKQTIQSCLDMVPKMNNADVNIYCHYDNAANMYEQVKIEGFVGKGTITIDAQKMVGNNLNGNIEVSGCTNQILIKGMTINSVNGKGVEVLRSTFVQLESIRVYGQSSGRCFYAAGGSHLLLKDCQGWDGAIIVYAVTLSTILVNNVAGQGTVRGVAAQHGGEIRLYGNNYPAGSTSNTYADSGGTISGTGTVYSTGKGTAPAVQYTKSITTYSGDNYSDSYNTWQGSADGVKQGNYGYGNRRGLWFFGTSILDNIGTGKTIKAMRVWFKRASRGGSSGAVRHSVRMHSYATKPAGQPTLSAEVGSISLGWGGSGWVNISSAYWASIANGTYKGFGIYTADGSSYSICNTECWVEITYV